MVIYNKPNFQQEEQLPKDVPKFPCPYDKDNKD